MGRKIHTPSIFQSKLEFASARGFQLAAEHPMENVALRALLAIFVLLILAYIYIVGASVLNIIARKEALAQSDRLSTEISSFEKDYFAVSHTVTPDAGVVLGLSPVSKISYVYRPGTVGQAQTQNNEI